MNSPSSLLTTLHKQQLMSKFITTNIYYCCSGPSETKYFPFQNVIVNIHVPWLPTKRRTVHKKVSEPGLLGCTLLREQFRSDIPFVSEMYERTGKMGVPSGDSTTPLIKIRFYQQREQDLEPHIYCKEKWKHSKLFNFQWTQKQVNRLAGFLRAVVQSPGRIETQPLKRSASWTKKFVPKELKQQVIDW